MKTFPIQQSSMDHRKHGLRALSVKGFRIPWHMAEKAYKTYIKNFGQDQSLEELAQRGGFGWCEFCLLYCGIRPVSLKRADGEAIMEDCSHIVVVDLLKVSLLSIYLR